MPDTTVIDIDLSAIVHNMAVLRRLVGADCSVCPVVKADAYGLGAVRVARALNQGGAAMFAVYTPEQAGELLAAAVSGWILVMMPVREIGRADDAYRGLICGRVHLAAHDPGHVTDLIRLSESYAVTIPVHLEVDTGMSRGGCNLDDAPEVLRRIARAPRIRLAGIFTQFACAESDAATTREQDDRFERLLADASDAIPPDCIVHAANTCAMLRDPRYHKSMVRVGQAWAGYGPTVLRDGDAIDGADALRPVLTLSSRIVHVKTVEKDATVGYGATWTARRKTVIGLVPVGYADGYPLALSNPAPASQPARSGRTSRTPAQVAVLVDTPDGTVRAHAPVIGRVSMDQLTVDLTNLGGRGQTLTRQVRPGNVVELISPERAAPNHVVRLAEIAGTNPYELLCGLSTRVRRVYHHQSAAQIEVKTLAAPTTATALATPTTATTPKTPTTAQVVSA